MALFQLIYVSTLVNPNPEVVKEVLEVSVENNKRNEITGMMLYADGNIVQALEGEKAVVIDTFSRILTDTRHKGIFLLFEDAIATRDFAAWSMGYRQITKSGIEKSAAAAHIFKVGNSEIALRVRPSNVLSVLKSFAS
jgi:hypothetical protein